MFSTHKNKKLKKIAEYLLIFSICSSSTNSFSWSTVHYLKSKYMFYLVTLDWKVYQYQKISVTCVTEISYHKWTLNSHKTVPFLMNYNFAVCIYELVTLSCECKRCCLILQCLLWATLYAYLSGWLSCTQVILIILSKHFCAIH